MEGLVMVDYGQAVTLIAKMLFLMSITVFLIATALLMIGLIVLGLVKVGKYLLVHISEAVHEPKENILERKLFALPQSNVLRVK